ncbi:hypothetical protein FNV43_RR07340 [Rhamnella rubrinervis]|uniref:Precursor of CEP14 n=1 Tax=Rhamnella rubrinervis TaxID=2594499 RepID=A0A8K0HGB7_9ROSA|nr:hypothetical protein FNV43_RR07340 [Rhamnella rubrinervis]
MYKLRVRACNGAQLMEFSMARLSSLALMVLLVVFASFVSDSQGRKLLVMEENRKVPSSSSSSSSSAIEESLFLSVLPKGTVPSSTPSKKGHAEVVEDKLIARHLIAIDRILQSVPSPGVGH